MKSNDSIFSFKYYGRIKLKLKDRMDERGLTRSRVADYVGTRFEVIDKWYNNEVERLDLDVLARICYILECEVGDLLEYELKKPIPIKNK